MSSTSNAALAEPWKQLWNGDLTVTDKIVAEDFVAHAARLTGTGSDLMHGRDALNGWVSGIHSILPDLSFEIQVGREVTFTGTDTLRIADGNLAEYWANADSPLFFRQLGIREVPVQE